MSYPRAEQFQASRHRCRLGLRGFTEVGGLHEFEDGRVVVVDFRENRVVLLDFHRNTFRDVTRPGEGPTELPLVLNVLPARGDTVVVSGHREVLKLSPEGKITGKSAQTFAAFQLRSYSAPMYMDRFQRMYGTSNEEVKRGAHGELIAPLTSNVIRFDPRANRLDTVAILSLRDPAQRLGDPWRPYPKRDAFAVLPGGDVIVFRAKGYVAELWRDGELVTRKPASYQPLRIGAAEREAYRDEKLRRSSGGGGGRGGQPGDVSDADSNDHCVEQYDQFLVGGPEHKIIRRTSVVGSFVVRKVDSSAR